MEPNSQFGEFKEIMCHITPQLTAIESPRSVVCENASASHHPDLAASDNFESDEESMNANDQNNEGDSDGNSRREILCVI